MHFVNKGDPRGEHRKITFALKHKYE